MAAYITSIGVEPGAKKELWRTIWFRVCTWVFGRFIIIAASFSVLRPWMQPCVSIIRITCFRPISVTKCLVTEPQSRVKRRNRKARRRARQVAAPPEVWPSILTTALFNCAKQRLRQHILTRFDDIFKDARLSSRTITKLHIRGRLLIILLAIFFDNSAGRMRILKTKISFCCSLAGEEEVPTLSESKPAGIHAKYMAPIRPEVVFKKLSESGPFAMPVLSYIYVCCGHKFSILSSVTSRTLQRLWNNFEKN